jgi:hypothetical protein
LHVEDIVFALGERIEVGRGFEIGYQDFRAEFVSLLGEFEADSCSCEFLEAVDVVGSRMCT